MIESSVIFLGGPFQFALTKQGFDGKLRSLIIRLLQELEDAGFQVLSAHRFESFGLMDVEGQSEKVAERDFQWMCQCDVFVALLPLDDDCKPVRSDGTCVELGWASALRKPIVVVRSTRHVYSHLITGLVAITSASTLDYEEVIRTPGLVNAAVLTALVAAGTSGGAKSAAALVATSGANPPAEECAQV
jgi:nucleoside 2-deoxyribosyltransferase